MSGPATAADEALSGGSAPEDAEPPIEVTEGREATVGAFRVRRALPRRERRTIGAWCFVDHFGPAAVDEDHGLDVGPHPHVGLQTVTWLLAGEALHRDSLGTEQVLRPGQLNLMTAGHGVAHSEEATGRYSGDLHGLQLWVAQPDSTRDGPAAFEHHGELPRLELDASTATVLVGDLGGVGSSARRDTDHVGVDLDLRPGTTVVPLRRGHEHGLVVVEGSVSIGSPGVGGGAGPVVVPGRLAHLAPGRDELALVTTGAARALLVGGMPFEEQVLMWWNFVARSRDEVTDAHRSWQARDDRFGPVASPLNRYEVDPPPWSRR